MVTNQAVIDQAVQDLEVFRACVHRIECRMMEVYWLSRKPHGQEQPYDLAKQALESCATTLGNIVKSMQPELKVCPDDQVEVKGVCYPIL